VVGIVIGVGASVGVVAGGVQDNGNIIIEAERNTIIFFQVIQYLAFEVFN
jgi:hypothetical protein